MQDYLAKSLEEARAVASRLGARGGRGGMASVKLEWNPYLGKWRAEANWSTGARASSSTYDTGLEAVRDLIHCLEVDLIDSEPRGA